MKILISIILIFSFLLKTNSLFSQIFIPILETYLEEQVNETSGLIIYNNEIWTHNDSGDEPKLYNIDPSNGTVKRTKIIKNAKNRDWEDICKDDKYAYIGDFGNNSGKLDEFIIYKILLEDLDSEVGDSIESQIIKFSYDPELYIKSEKKHTTNFDCEAIIAKGDSLFIFSKNWEDKKCYFYSLPKIPGNYIANIRDTLDVEGLICGADYNEKTNTIALIGYVYGIPAPSLLVLLSDFENNDFFNGKVIRKELSLKGCQTEGIIFIDDYSLLISNEKFLRHKEALHRIYIADRDKRFEDSSFYFEIKYDKILNELVFQIPVKGRYKLQLIDSKETTVYKKAKTIKAYTVNKLSMKNFESGNYKFILYNSKTKFSTIFTK